MPTQDSYPALAALDPTTYVTGFYTSGGQLVTVKVPFAFIYGNKWNVGSGAPTIQGIATGDLYLDQTTGDVWRWNQTALNWGSAPFMNIVNGEFTWPLWVPSKPTSSQVMGALDSPWNGSITTNFQNCYATADVAATASTVFSITQNGGQIGTLTFGAGQTVGTFSTGGPFNINKSDVIRVIAPASQDATLSGVRISLVFAVGGTVGATALLGLALQKANNLSDVANVPASRHSLGLDTVDSPTFTQLSLNYSGAGTTLTATSSGSTNTIHVTDTGVNGVGITMTGSGATTPTKTMRVNSGHWQIVNNAYSAVVFDVDDSGNFTTNGGGGTVGSFVTTGQASLAGTVGHESLRAVPVGSAVNWLQVAGATTGSAVTMQAAGSDTNVALNISSKGASPIQFWTNSIGTAQFVVNDTPGANRYLTVTGSNGGNPTIGASAGSVAFSTNVVVNGTFDTTGQTSLAGTPGAEALRAITVGSAVNWVQVQGATSGNGPGISSRGSDANIDIAYSTQGTGRHSFWTGSFSRPQFAIADTANAVNYLQVTGGATGNNVSVSAQGSDANIGINYYTNGGGWHSFWTNGVPQVAIVNTPSANRYLTLTGSNGGNPTIGTSAGSVAFASPIAINGSTAHSVLLGQGTGNVTGVGPNATSGLALMSQGASADPIFGNPTGTLINVQRFTTVGSTTYTPTAGTNSIIFEVQGGGGAGGGAPTTSSGQVSCGGGGAAGAYAKGRLTSGFSGATVTVGAGGTGVNGATGNVGGNSVFGSTTAIGGAPGSAAAASTSSNAAGGNGGAVTGTAASIVNIQGSPGLAAVNSASPSFISGAVGGSNALGQGGNYSFGANGNPGTGFGGGGSGTFLGASSSAVTGGAGAQGVVIVWEYA